MIIPIETIKKHVCSICKNEFDWNDNASLYCLLEDQHGVRKVLGKYCSPKCQSKSIYRNKN